MAKKKIHTEKSPEEVSEKMKQQLKENKLLLSKQLNGERFKIVSQKNYGTLSIVEKEYYTIKGKFNKQDDQTEIAYQVKGNATFGMISTVVPLILLPIVLYGAAGGDESNFFTCLITYFAMAGIVVFFSLNQERKLRSLGEKDFGAFLKNKIIGEMEN